MMGAWPMKLLVLLALCAQSNAIEGENNGTELNLNGIIPELQNVISQFKRLFVIFRFLPDTTCSQDLYHVAKAVLQKEEWALKYLDSFGKPPSGLAMGNFHWVGSFEECRNVKSTYKLRNGEEHQFQGKACDLRIPSLGSVMNIDKKSSIRLSLTIGICVPDSCNKTDLNKVLDYSKDNVSFLQKSVVKCVPNEIPWDWKGTLALCLLCISVAVITAATVYDISTTSSNSDTAFNTLTEMKDMSKTESTKVNLETLGITQTPNSRGSSITQLKNGALLDLTKTFSAYTNTKKILNTDNVTEPLSCIHGIRFLSMTWIILGHTYSLGINNYADLKNIETINDNRAFQVLLTAGTYPVDSFFLIGGTLVTYLFLQQARKLGGIKKIPWVKFYVHRYWRLTPTYMWILCMHVCLYPHLSSGPFWDMKSVRIDHCSSWWKNLLYINNLFPLKTMCMDWSWYLANDMQFYILSPLYLIPLTVFPIVGIAIVFALCLASWIGTGFTLGNIVTSASTGTNIDMLYRSYLDDYYFKPWTRIGPYLIGSLLGYILHRSNGKIRIPKALVLIGWLLAAAMNLSLVYGVRNTHPSITTIKVLYTLGRSAWALGLSWVILCCCTGNGGVVHILLSWKALIPLSRLTYCAYLVHPAIIYYSWYSRRYLIESSHSVLVPFFCGFLLLSYGLAFAVSLMIESPMIALEKLINKKMQWHCCFRKNKSSTRANSNHSSIN